MASKKSGTGRKKRMREIENQLKHGRIVKIEPIASSRKPPEPQKSSMSPRRAEPSDKKRRK